jgi:hypothetical protein
MCSLLTRETWEQIIICLPTSPASQANGIACASRVLNTRWRAMHRKIVQEMVTDLRKETLPYGDVHLLVLDLEDIIGPRVQSQQGRLSGV